ncbi:MAG: hypothetical protein IT363_12255 [Methanoregulaceae archaeon]|nr:hypothetical protein [Methanoregulaceae archaeon]
MAAAARVILEAILLSVVYGIAHDMVTAHVWVEYFTVHHARVVASTDPVVMALVWGVLATWWVGVFAGILLWAFAVAGSLPSLPIERLRQIMLRGLSGLYISAMLVLGLSYIGLGWIGQGHDIPDLEVRRRALAVGITHMYSYSAGALLILAMGVRALQLRIQAAKGSGASQGPDFG